MPGPLEPIDPVDIGMNYEATLSDEQRRLGAHYTPTDVAQMLTRRAFAALDDVRMAVENPVRVCDPSCGGGAFLLAAADQLLDRGVEPAFIVNELLTGWDLDEGAASATERALIAWAASHGVTEVVPRVEVRDGLSSASNERDRFDIIVGNPPFQGQLDKRTARSKAERERLAERFGPAASGYVDTASLFQLLSLELLRPGGVAVLIQPRSFLVARDSRAVREQLASTSRVLEAWVPGEKIFAAHVDVCAIVLAAEQPVAGSSVHVVSGRDGSRRSRSVLLADLRNETWSPVWAQAHGVPAVDSFVPRTKHVSTTPARVGDVAATTAGFRDQYYGFLPHLRSEEPASSAKLITTAMIDPASCSWPTRTVAIARQHWVAPWLDLDSLAADDESLWRWTMAQLRPKVLLATQTTVIEAVADNAGGWVPMTPIISVLPHADKSISAAHLEAALLAPPATAWAFRRFGGGGMSPTALKLAARHVREIPLPIDAGAWDAGVDLLRDIESGANADTTAQWMSFGSTMCASWGLDDSSLVAWWWQRTPRFKREQRGSGRRRESVD